MKTFVIPQDLEDFINAYDKKDISIWQNMSNRDMKAFRTEARKHYLKIQNRKCCYCQMYIPSTNGSHWHVEHILPRVLFPQFLFEPYNLAVICPDCNNAKRDQNPHVDGDRACIQITYPKVSGRFKIIHPLYDDYSEHIIIQNAYHCDYPDHYFLIGISPKGKKTINMCNLNRFFQEFAGFSDMRGKQIQKIDDFIELDLTTATPQQKRQAVQKILESM